MLIFGIFMLAELPEAAKHSAKVSASLDEMLSSEEVWIPTVILAEEIAEQIGPRREVTGFVPKGLIGLIPIPLFSRMSAPSSSTKNLRTFSASGVPEAHSIPA